MYLSQLAIQSLEHNYNLLTNLENNYHHCYIRFVSTFLKLFNKPANNCDQLPYDSQILLASVTL